MEALSSFFSQTEIVFIVLAGGTACLLALGISAIATSATDPVRRRLAAQMPAAGEAESKPKTDFSRVVEKYAKYLLPQKKDELDKVSLKLIQAGYRSPKALRQFYAYKAGCAVSFPLVTWLATRWMPGLTSTTILFFLAAAAFIGVILPNIVLDKVHTRRVKSLRNAFPDALDLLVVCVESGLGLTAALDRVARELDVSHPELAEELALVNVEIRAGIERPVALRNLATRSGVNDIGGMVALLIQTIRFGTSVAEALRVYSEEFRDKRMQRAEEQAAKIGTKMIFPLVLCLFPSFFIVAVGPAAMRIIWAFSQM